MSVLSMNSIEEVIKEFFFGEKLQLSDEEEAVVRKLATLIGQKILFKYEDHAISTEYIRLAGADVVNHEVDKLIREGHHVITIRGMSIG